jgi:hypothetical protein
MKGADAIGQGFALLAKFHAGERSGKDAVEQKRRP